MLGTVCSCNNCVYLNRKGTVEVLPILVTSPCCERVSLKSKLREKRSGLQFQRDTVLRGKEDVAAGTKAWCLEMLYKTTRPAPSDALPPGRLRLQGVL